MAIFKMYSGAQPTTAITAQTSTGTAIKTFLQYTAPAAHKVKVRKWGVEQFGTSAAAEPTQWELLTTGTVAGGSPTAYTPIKFNDADGAAAAGTGGILPSSEGTITTTRVLALKSVHNTSSFQEEFSLGNEPEVAASDVLRIRCDAAAAVNAICWIEFEE